MAGDATTLQDAVEAALALKPKEIAILSQAAKKAINFRTRKVIRSLKLGREKALEREIATLTDTHTIDDVDKLIKAAMKKESKSNNAKKKKRKKSKSGTDTVKDPVSGETKSQQVAESARPSRRSSAAELLQQYRRHLVHLELYRECTGPTVATEYLYRKKLRGIETRRKKYIQRQERRRAAIAAVQQNTDETSTGSAPITAPSLNQVAAQEKVIEAQKAAITKRLLCGGDPDHAADREVEKRDLVTGLLEMKAFQEGIEKLQAHRQKKQFEEKLAKQRIKRREKLAIQHSNALTMTDMWIGQLVLVVSYTKLKSVCKERQQQDFAREEQQDSSSSSSLRPIKHAAKWMGDKGRRADLRGEVSKLDKSDGSVQVRFEKTNRDGTKRTFHDWFVPAALLSCRRQRISKAQSEAEQKKAAIQSDSVDADGGIVAKGTLASNLKGRARKRAARSEIYRRKQVLEGTLPTANKPSVNAESMFLDSLGSASKPKSAKRAKRKLDVVLAPSSSASVKPKQRKTTKTKAPVGKNDQKGEQHPSWKAKQAQRELMRKALSSGGTGKKIIFD